MDCWVWKYICEDFQRSFFFWERSQAVTASVSLIITFILGGLSALGAATIIGLIPSIIAIGLPVWLGSLLILVTPARMWKREREKVIGYETIKLDISYDEADPQCRRYLPDDGQWQWSVRVKGTKGKPSKNVIVRLEKTDPPLHDLHAALHPMSGVGIMDSRWKGDGSFNIRPDDTEYVNVIRYHPPSGLLWIVAQFYPHLGRAIDYGSYTLHLTARGNDGPGIFATYRLEVGDGIPQFYLVDEIKAS